MEKLDATIATVGAVVLVAALGIVGVQGDATGYAVTFVEREQGIGEGNRQHAGEGAFTDVYTWEIDDPAVTRLHVVARASFLTAGPTQQVSLHATLRAPNGTEYVEEVGPGAGGPTLQGSIMIDFDVNASDPPAPLVVDAPDGEAALADAANRTAVGAAVGTWTLELSFASGPVPANSATSSWEGRLWGWSPRLVPAAGAK